MTSTILFRCSNDWMNLFGAIFYYQFVLIYSFEIPLKLHYLWLCTFCYLRECSCSVSFLFLHRPSISSMNRIDWLNLCRMCSNMYFRFLESMKILMLIELKFDFLIMVHTYFSDWPTIGDRILLTLTLWRVILDS